MAFLQHYGNVEVYLIRAAMIKKLPYPFKFQGESEPHRTPLLCPFQEKPISILSYYSQKTH